MTEKTITAEEMREIHTKLEDVYNSQAALNQKMAIVQMALEAAPNEELEASLNEAFGNAQRNADLIKQAAHKYEMAMNARQMEER